MRAETELENGRDLLGRFWLAEKAAEQSHVTPGVLRWSRGDGATLRLIGPLDGWPRQPGGKVTVQGVTVTGDDVTLMDALVVSTALGGRATASIAGPTLLLRGGGADRCLGADRASVFDVQIREPAWQRESGHDTENARGDRSSHESPQQVRSSAQLECAHAAILAQAPRLHQAATTPVA